MIFSYFCILSSCVNRLQQCTKKNYMTVATNSNYQQFFGKSKPLYIRFYKRNCIYTPASQAYWEEASKLLPNMQFVTAECEQQATTFCNYAKGLQSIDSYPKFRVYLPNQTTSVAQFGDNPNIHSASTYFTNVATDYGGYIPFDNPLIENLIPQSTNNFYKLYKNPIFLLYNSNCEEDVTFIDQFYKKLSSNEIASGDFGFGKLDCGLYPDECDKWGGQVPSANVFSRSKGISTSISTIDNFNERIKTAISQLEANNKACPTPEPLSKPKPVPTPDYSDYTIIKNEKLEVRSLSDIQKRYITATTKTYQGSCCTTKCGNDLKGGNAETCTDYELQPQTIPDFLRQLNFYRELAGVPHDVTNDETLNLGCYLAAQYLSYKKQLSHSADDKKRNQCGSWNSNWDLLKQTLAQSNLAQGDVAIPPLNMMNGLMDDLGTNNEKEVGHRRWFLYPYLKTIGFGFYPLAMRPYGQYYAQTHETGVFRVSHNQAVNEDHPDVPFIAWPAPGPFPVARVPESFSLTFSGFKGLTVDDISITMTRDDGEYLPYASKYLNYDQSISCLSSCLIWKLSNAQLELCSANHKLHVQVTIEKTKQIIDYTIEFFDNNVQEESCFYSTNRNKCPSTLDSAHVFGPGEYSNIKIGNSATVINVAEDITLSSDLVLTGAKVNIQGAKIKGKIVVGTTTSLDIADPSLTDIVIQCNPAGNNLVSGSLSTTIQPKSLRISLTALPTYTSRPGKTLIYNGGYIKFDYQKEVETIDYIYHFSIYFTGTKAYLSSIPIRCSKNLCYQTQILGDCSIFNDFSEMKNFISPTNKIYKLYLQKPISLTTKGWSSNVYANSKYIIYSNENVELQYTPSLSTRVREIYIEPASAKNNLDAKFSFVNSDRYPAPYFNQEIFETRYPLNNLFLSRYTTNSKQYQIPGLMGDATAIQVTSYNEQKVYNDSQSTSGTYQYTDEYDYPLFVTDGQFDEYTFTTTNEQAVLRVQPTDQTKYSSVTLNFPSQANFSSIFVQDYYYLTIKASSDIFKKIRLVNVKQAKFVDLNGNAASGISTDVIANNSIDWSSTSKVSFERLNFRTDTIAKLDNCECTNAYVYDSNPVIQGLKLTNLQLINSNPTLKNCQVTGDVIINLTDNVLPAIQLVGNSVFNPTSFTIHISSTLSELSLFLVGISSSQASSLSSKINILNDGDSTYKVVASKDGKALYLATGDFNENEAPAVVDATNDFLINEHRIVSETFTLNPPPPGFEYTDSILDPLDEPPKKPSESPTSKPEQPTNDPASPVIPSPTEVPALPPPVSEYETAPETIIKREEDGVTTTIDTENVKESHKFEITHEQGSTPNYVIRNDNENVDLKLNIADTSSEVKVTVENSQTSLLIHGETGANLKLTNSENVDISGSGSFSLNSADSESLTINKFIPSESTTLSTEKELNVKEVHIYGDVSVIGDQSNEAHYNVQNIKIEQGGSFTSKNLKVSSVQIGIGSRLNYYDSDFSESDIKIYYNKQSQGKHPIEFNKPSDASASPKSLTVLDKDIGTTLSEERFIIATKDFTGQNIEYSSSIEESCKKWASSFVAEDSPFTSLSYEITKTKDGKLEKVTLYCTNNNEKPKKKGLPVGVIAGIVVGVVVVIAIVVITVVIVLRRKKLHEKSTDDAELPPADNNEKEQEKELKDIENPTV